MPNTKKKIKAYISNVESPIQHGIIKSVPKTFKSKYKVPEIYVSESRDFQLFLTLLDMVENSLKFDIDNIPNILDTDKIPDHYLNNLKSKIGFYTKNQFPDDMLRFALSAFPYIIKNKGSKKGIELCLNVFLKLEGLQINIDNILEIDNTDYLITITLPSKKRNLMLSLLDELLNYIKPTGYLINYVYINSTDIENPYM